MALPLYGFREGDTVGLLILADEQETVGFLAQRLQEAASLRVAPSERIELFYRNRKLDPMTTLHDAGFVALDRFDVREG
jgi:Toluene-4-monooxygenase system protein B (TmoB)